MKIEKIFVLIALVSFSLSWGLSAQPRGGGGGSPGNSGGKAPGGSPGRPSAPPPRPSKPSNSSSSSHSSSTHTQSYNGMRLSSTHAPFQVVLIECSDDEINVSFNIPVDPTTFKRTNILINETHLEKSAKIRFNKTGKLVKIKTESLKNGEITLEFKNVKSYDDESLGVRLFKSIFPGSVSEFPVFEGEHAKEHAE